MNPKHKERTIFRLTKMIQQEQKRKERMEKSIERLQKRLDDLNNGD